ncbi:MAG TPA: hypothetical protein GXX34_11910 [Clostridia bacterium]|nr:hypothetical protein [Clostridia bacterium]
MLAGKEFLEGFEKRMQLVAVVDAVLHRRRKNMELESLFAPGHMENLIFSVLVFIMEKTLAEDEACTIESIIGFLRDILPAYGVDLPYETVRQLADYIVKDVLQHGGEARYFPVMKYGQGMTEFRVKLIDDRLKETEYGYEVQYLLTDQGYDFLFRTKEVEQEISFTIEELKLRELIRRKNYRKAQQQSASLVQMIRQKKREMEQFMYKVRENIYAVDIADLERLLNSTYELLEEEYNLLAQIKEMVALSEQRLLEEEGRRLVLDEEMQKAKREILAIRHNINTALKEQRDMVVERFSLSKIYLETLQDTFAQGLTKRFDLEKEILLPLEECSPGLIPQLWQLLNPLFLPNPNKILGLMSIYQRQVPLREVDQEAEGILVESLEEDLELERIQRLNEAHVTLMKLLFQFDAGETDAFYLSELVDQLEARPQLLGELMTENLLFTDMLKLYEIGAIDVAAWLDAPDEAIMNATGELDVDYCLHRLFFEEPSLYGVAELKFTKAGDSPVFKEIRYQRQQQWYRQQVTFTDLLIEVKRR